VDGMATQRTGELIRQARLERELGVVELARLAGVSPATVSKIERGRRPAVTIAMADRILAACTISLICFMARRGEGFQSRDPREKGSEHYLCIAGRFRVRLIDQYQPVLWADIDPLPEVIGMLPSINRLPLPAPLTKVRVALVPLTEIQATDGYARRVIERMTVRR
jgi:transcriptional regulator with XRE-family HTH domain